MGGLRNKGLVDLRILSLQRVWVLDSDTRFFSNPAFYGEHGCYRMSAILKALSSLLGLLKLTHTSLSRSLVLKSLAMLSYGHTKLMNLSDISLKTALVLRAAVLHNLPTANFLGKHPP